MPASMPGACNLVSAMKPAKSETTSHLTEAHAISITGQRVEASTAAVSGRMGQAGAVGAGDNAEAVIESWRPGAYSNSLGFSGALGGGSVAFSTRASKLERKAAPLVAP